MLFSLQYDSQDVLLKATIKAGDMMNSSGSHSLLLAAIGSFLLWTDSYFLLHALNRKRSAEWNCRLITVVHALLSTTLCFTSAFVTGPWPFSYLGEVNTSLHNAAVVLSLGYFLFDFAWCMYMKTEGSVMLAHHVVSIFGLSYVLYQNKSGCELTAVVGASELTNPLLQLRWFLKSTGRYHGRTALLLDWTFVVLFLTSRLGAGTAFHYVCQTSPKLDLITKAGGQAFYIISVIFGFQLCKFLYRKYFLRRPQKGD